MPVLLPVGTDCIRLIENMKAQGIQTSIRYPTIHHFPVFQNVETSILPVTEDMAQREANHPLYC
jgi:dTDP-4-amino-4,6-dideoxygalactose transaminase